MVRGRFRRQAIWWDDSPSETVSGIGVQVVRLRASSEEKLQDEGAVIDVQLAISVRIAALMVTSAVAV